MVADFMPGDSNIIGLRCSLGVGTFRCFPGGTSGHPRLHHHSLKTPLENLQLLLVNQLLHKEDSTESR